MLDMLMYLKTCFGDNVSDEDLQTVVEYITMNGYYFKYPNGDNKRRTLFHKDGKLQLIVKLDSDGNLNIEEYEPNLSNPKSLEMALKSKTLLKTKERYEFINRLDGLIIASDDYKIIKYYNEQSCRFIYSEENKMPRVSDITTKNIPPYINPDDEKVLSDQEASDDISRILAVKSYADNIREQVKSQKTGEKQM